MFLRLFATNTDWTITIVRIVLGVIFFAHGAQKMLCWYGGAGFQGTMQALTGFVKIPAPVAFLVIAGEFLVG
jgi:putative oxidoreductase